MVPRASAQVSVGWYGYLSSDSRSRQPMLNSTEIGSFARALQLNDQESQLFMAVYSAYLSEWKQSERTMRETVSLHLEEAELLQSNEPTSHIEPIYNAWKARVDAMDKQLLEDLATLLTEDQQRLWPIAERELRRLRQIPKAVLGSEGVDVIILVDHIVPSEHITPVISEILERYSQDLDGALVRRDRAIEADQEQFRELLKSDVSRAESMYLRVRRLRLAVCEINERATRAIAHELPEALAARLNEEFEKRAYKMYLQPTHFEKQLEFAETQIMLNQDQREAFNALVVQYLAAVAKLHQREIVERKRIEREELPPFFAKAKADPENMDNPDEDDLACGNALITIRRDRLALDRATRDRLRGVLTHEQWQKIPDGTNQGVNRYYYWRESARL